MESFVITEVTPSQRLREYLAPCLDSMRINRGFRFVRSDHHPGPVFDEACKSNCDPGMKQTIWLCSPEHDHGIQCGADT